MIDAEFKQIFNLPFTEAESFFKQKLNIPTEHWTDLWQGEHAKGFMSAGAYHADLLADLRGMVDKAIAGGVSKKEFREQFRPLVTKHGWQLQGGGPAWRSDLIWQTNRATAFAAGRWQQLESAGIKYLRYVHADGIMHPRPTHLAMHGIVRPRTDAFWSVNYPPNGFRCHCRAEPVSDKEYAATPQRLKELPADWQTAPDVGWRYNVGSEGAKEGYKALAKKFEALPEDIARAWMSNFLKEPPFAQFFAQKIAGDFPVAILNEADKAALGATTQTVWFSPKSLKDHLEKHPDIGIEDYQKVQRLLDEGEVYQKPGKEERLVYLTLDGKLYRAAVKTTKDKAENFFLTLFETTDEKSKRTLLFGKYKRIR